MNDSYIAANYCAVWLAIRASQFSFVLSGYKYQEHVSKEWSTWKLQTKSTGWTSLSEFRWDKVLRDRKRLDEYDMWYHLLTSYIQCRYLATTIYTRNSEYKSWCCYQCSNKHRCFILFMLQKIWGRESILYFLLPWMPWSLAHDIETCNYEQATASSIRARSNYSTRR